MLQSPLVDKNNLVISGADIRPWLDRLGISLHEAERRLGIHRVSIYRWMESGEVLSRSAQLAFWAVEAGCWEFLPKPARAARARDKYKVKDSPVRAVAKAQPQLFAVEAV